MINVKKGTAHSLAQSDWIGTISYSDPFNRVPTVAITAGQIISRTGAPTMVVAGGSLGAGNSTAPAVLGIGTLGDQWGFAVNSTDEGDTIESGKVGAYAADGNSVIETDQVVQSITPANFYLGSAVYAYVGTGGSKGLVTSDAAAGANQLVGTVDSIRTIFVGQTPNTLLGIKLA